MPRTTPALVAVVLVVGTLAALPMAGLAQTETESSANASVAPGERLAGVVGVGQAELDGEVATRTFQVRVARADSNASRAAVVADQVTDLRERLDELAQRRADLRQARENGSLSDGEFRARMAQLYVETQTAQRLAARSANASRGLPAEALQARGINASAIQTLRNRASELSGPEVAEIARSIAGPGAGRPVVAGNASERAGGPGPDRGGRPTEAGGEQRGGTGQDRPVGTATRTPAGR